MAKNRKTQINEIAGKGLQTVQTLSVQFVTYLIAEGAKGKALDKIIATFARHQTKLIGGLLGSAGLAGGVWAAASLWTSSLGLWGSVGYAIGLVTMPAWIPIYAGSETARGMVGGLLWGVVGGKGRAGASGRGPRVGGCLGASRACTTGQRPCPWRFRGASPPRLEGRTVD